MVSATATKDPRKVAAGLASARARWGDTPRMVRLDDLSQPQRRLVLALVDAAKKEAAAEGQTAAAGHRGGTHDAAPEV